MTTRRDQEMAFVPIADHKETLTIQAGRSKQTHQLV
jgi:hypothetical protein